MFRKNTEKVPIEKEVTRIDKNGEKIRIKTSYILLFTDSARFMSSSLTNLVNNLCEEIHKIKCKFRHDDRKHERCKIKYKYCNCFLEYTNFKDNLIEYKCLCCNKNYQQEFDEGIKKRVLNTYKFSNHHSNNFMLLLRKGVNPHEYQDDWENKWLWVRVLLQSLKRQISHLL